MIFKAINSHNPDKIALQDKEKVILYGDLEKEIDNRVKSLIDVSCLGIMQDNSIEWVLWDLAALKDGITCVPIPPFFTEDQISYALQSAGVSHVLSPNGLIESGAVSNIEIPKGTVKITFTSGTTGTPKGVCLPKSAMENVASSVVQILGEEFTGTHAIILPLAILLENVAGVYASLIAGCTVYLTSLQTLGSSYEHLHHYLKKTKATSVILMPEILRLLMVQVITQGTLPNLKFIAVGGSKIDSSLIEQARKMQLPVYEGYGLSECASVVSLNTPNDDQIGSVGKALPHISINIVDNEIQIKDPGFLGYIGENAPPVFPSGDLGTLDKYGFLSVTGRKKNVLITSYGRNISPEWVEATLLAQPSIAQTIVYGDAEPYLSALIVPSSPNIDIQGAINKANATLPNYAQIHDFQIVPPFTMKNDTLTGTGRPRRKEILTLYTKEKSYELLRPAS